MRSDGVQLVRSQVAVAPLRKRPPDWTAFAVETASLLLQPQPFAGAVQLPDQLRLALTDAGRRLAVAAGARLGSPAQQCMALPEPATARAAMQGERPFAVCATLGCNGAKLCCPNALHVRPSPSGAYHLRALCEKQL